MSKCQKYVKCQKVKHTDYGGGSQTKINSHNEVHTYWCQFWHQLWRSPKLFKNTFYAHFEGFWSPSYVTSKLISVCVNLIMWIYFFLWTSSIVHVFDFLTFDIFLTTWHLFDNLTSFWQLNIFFWHVDNGTHGQMGIMVNTEDRDGAPWGMGHMGDGHMGDGAHGQWGTWTMGHMGKGVLWLILNIEIGYLRGWGTWAMG